jgi:simple sugar transport system permease protein
MSRARGSSALPKTRERIIPAWATSLAAFIAALVCMASLIAFSSADPAASLASFFARPFSSAWRLGNMLDMTGLLVLAGTGSAIALRAGNYNLAGEAQIYAPALASAVILARFPAATDLAPGYPAAVWFAIALFSALAIGAALGLVPGLLRSRLGVSELLSSFLLSAALVPVVDYLVSGPFRDATGNLVATTPIAEALRLTPALPPSTLNWSFPATILLAVGTWFFVSRTKPGYRLRMTGSAPEFARYAGFPSARIRTLSMTASGMFHALAGFLAVTGTWFRCHEGFSAGMGWSALAIALVARGNALAVIPAALALSWLESASDAAVLSASLSFDPTPLLQAIIFLLISARVVGARRLP